MTGATEYFHPLTRPFSMTGSNGEAVVFVHGFTGSTAHFRLIAPIVHDAGYTVEAPALAGHGTSIDDMASTFAPDWFRSVRDAVAAVGDHDRIHLFGFSMGGLLALSLADELPIATLTTLNAPVKFQNPKIYLTGVAHRWEPYVPWDDGTGEDPTARLDPEAQELWLGYDGFPTRQAHELAQLSQLARRRARRVPVPTLIIQSRADEATHPGSATILADRVPTNRVVWLERAVHNSLLDDERTVIATEFLSHIGQTSPS